MEPRTTVVQKIPIPSYFPLVTITPSVLQLTPPQVLQVCKCDSFTSFIDFSNSFYLYVCSFVLNLVFSNFFFFFSQSFHMPYFSLLVRQHFSLSSVLKFLQTIFRNIFFLSIKQKCFNGFN